MSEIEGISGGQPPHHLTPEELESYKSKYTQGVKLFKEGFKGYSEHSQKEAHQREQFAKVMKDALRIMNEAASGAMQEGKLQQGQQLSKDYQAFIKDPSEENQENLAESIKKLP